MEVHVCKRVEFTLGVSLNHYTMNHVQLLKQIDGRRWVPKERMWTIPYSYGGIERLLELFGHDEMHIEEALVGECPLLAEWLETREYAQSSGFGAI